MSSIEIDFKCSRCDRELVVAPPLLFKHPTLTITIMRCNCKDAAQPAVQADALSVDADREMVGDIADFNLGDIGNK